MWNHQKKLKVIHGNMEVSRKCTGGSESKETAFEEPGVSGFLGIFINKELIKKRFKSLPPASLGAEIPGRDRKPESLG